MPALNLETEKLRPEFVRLVKSGIGVANAARKLGLKNSSIERWCRLENIGRRRNPLMARIQPAYRKTKDEIWNEWFHGTGWRPGILEEWKAAPFGLVVDDDEEVE